LICAAVRTAEMSEIKGWEECYLTLGVPSAVPECCTELSRAEK